MNNKFVDLTGMVFENFTVLGFSGKDKSGDRMWLCLCSCGNKRTVSGGNLKRGKSKSCGCFKRLLHKYISGVESKKCSLCTKWKPLSEFPLCKSRWDGINNHCKSCSVKQSSIQFNKRRKVDMGFRIKSNLSARIWYALKGKKSRRTEYLIGCSIEYFLKYIESMFDDKMNWSNYGSYWQIDHKIPCRAFDLRSEAEQKKCFHFTNMQPLEKSENISKGDLLPDGTRARYAT